LEDLKNGQNLTGIDRLTIQLAEQQLSSQASTEPGIYLPAISALHRILSVDKKVKPGDIAIAEKAIQKTLAQTNTMPSLVQNPADMGLAKGYYKILNHLNR
jgi:hypothetical protein